MAPRKTTKATGAARSPTSIPLAETSANAAGSSSTAGTLKRKTGPKDTTGTQQNDEAEASSSIHEPASKKQRNSTGIISANDTEERANKALADDTLKHLDAIYRRLKELNDKIETADQRVEIEEVKDLALNTDDTVENIRSELEDVAKESMSEDILGKIDEVIETIGDRFDELDDKVHAVQTTVTDLRIEQTFGLKRLVDRLDGLEEKLDRPTPQVHYHYPPVWAAPPQAAPQYR